MKNQNAEGADIEKLHFNVARLDRGGERFEVVIDSDKAAAFRSGGLDDIAEVLKAEHVFSDAKKGMRASENHMKAVFGTSDPIEVAKVILSEGRVQTSASVRDSHHDARLAQVIELVHRNAIDPQTNLPHPVTRIRNAIEQARIKIDDSRSADGQLEDVVKKLRPIIPLKFETKQLQVVVPTSYAQAAYKRLKGYGRTVKESWQSDGTLFIVIAIPAGIQNDVIDQVNKLAHGDCDIKVLED